ncbi:SPFH/Band 7/PHB domain protein [Opisthorchis viverrini]|uniref:SPFH/Band 7/PHB domain protein n=2 Tax=Opisthorchis viverrini TaxID=6198 RepID=A0A1S8X2Z4_OPIVI|nr:SPFH/Band 7/PHB domain protein [Opisthorchis viverrini]
MEVAATPLPFKGHLRSLFRKGKSDGDKAVEATEYIFAYEDKTRREEAKQALSFGQSDLFGPPPTESKLISGTLPYEFPPAFEFTGNTIWDTEADSSPQYKTIFTYSELPVTGNFLVDHEDPLGTHVREASSAGLSILLRALSLLLLILLFPFLCWFSIKHLSDNERLIVFRLGRRLKLKGPGFVLLLPFCDRHHLIRLDEQKLEVTSVQGGTEDQAVAELKCSLVYKLSDPDYAFLSTTEPPSKWLNTQAQLCLLSSLTRLSWKQLNDGGAKQDLVADAMSSLNLRCGAHGIIVSQMEILELHLIRPAPSPETVKKLKMSTIQKQLQAISSAFLHRGPTSSVPSKQTERTESVALTTVNELPAALPPTQDNSKVLNSPLDTSRSTRETVCNQAIARAQPFLNNDLACRALGRTTMQLFVSSKAFSEPLPTVANALDDDQLTLMYLDSRRGLAAMGALPTEEPPTVTLYLTASDMSDVLNGRLNLMEAVNQKAAFMVGDAAVFNKLRHLLYLKTA